MRTERLLGPRPEVGPILCHLGQACLKVSVARIGREGVVFCVHHQKRHDPHASEGVAVVDLVEPPTVPRAEFCSVMQQCIVRLEPHLRAVCRPLARAEAPRVGDVEHYQFKTLRHVLPRRRSVTVDLVSHGPVDLLAPPAAVGHRLTLGAVPKARRLLAAVCARRVPGRHHEAAAVVAAAAAAAVAVAVAAVAVAVVACLVPGLVAGSNYTCPGHVTFGSPRVLKRTSRNS